MRSWRKRVYFKLKGSRVLMKEIINFIEANVDGKTLFGPMSILWTKKVERLCHSF